MSILKRLYNWVALNDAVDERADSALGKPITARRKTGNAGEDHALALLKKRGDRLVTRNWSCKSGELDLVTWDKDTLVFTEVRTRAGIEFGAPAETVDAPKQEKLRRTVHQFLVTHFRDGRLPPCRYDIVWIVAKGGTIAGAEIIVGAFV